MGCTKSLEKLADDIAAVCVVVLDTDAIEVVKVSRTAWDDDGSGQFSMNVGTIHEYGIVRVEERHIFGWRWLKYRKRPWLVLFGGDEFFADGYLRKPWCEVHDPRLADAVGPMVESRMDHFTPGWCRDKLSFKLFTPP